MFVVKRWGDLPIGGLRLQNVGGTVPFQSSRLLHLWLVICLRIKSCAFCGSVFVSNQLLFFSARRDDTLVVQSVFDIIYVFSIKMLIIFL